MPDGLLLSKNWSLRGGLISREQLDAKTAEYATGVYDDHDHHHDPPTRW